MKFECDSCHAQYMIADEKLGARGVKVKCKRCSHVIIVRPAASSDASDADTAARGRDTFVEREPGTTPDGAEGLGLADDDLGAFGSGLSDDEPTRATFDADTEVAASESDDDTIAGDRQLPSPVAAADESTVVGPAPRLTDDGEAARPDDENPFLKKKPAAADFGAAEQDEQEREDPFQGLGNLDGDQGDLPADDDAQGAFAGGDDSVDGSGDDVAERGASAADDEDGLGAAGQDASGDEDGDVPMPSMDEDNPDGSLRMDSELDDNPFFGDGAGDGQASSAEDGGVDVPAPPPPDAFASDPGDASASMPSVEDGDDLLEGELAGAFGAMFADADDAERGSTQVLDLQRVDQLRAESARSEMQGGGLDALRSGLEDDVGGFGGMSPWGADGAAGGRTLEGPAEGSLESQADDDDEGGWHAAIDDEDVGPLSLKQVGEHIKKGGIDRETLVWRPGMDDWTPAGEIREVRPLFDAVPLPKIASSSEGASSFDVGAPIDDLKPSPFGSGEGRAEVADPFGPLSGFDTDSDGAWQPHGLTEVYQAANLAEAAGGLGGAPAAAAASLPGGSSGGLDDDDDDGGWKPAAGSALASLVSNEIERLDTPGFGESSLPPAADDSLSLNLDSSPLGGISSGGLDVPGDTEGDALGASSFGAPPPMAGSGFGGSLPPQGSLAGMPMAPYAGAPTSPLKNPLVLIAGVGGTVIVLLFVVVLLLVLRDPVAPVVAQAPAAGAAPTATPGTPAPAPAATTDPAAGAAATPPAAAEPAASAEEAKPSEPTPTETAKAPEEKAEPPKVQPPKEEKKPARVASATQKKPERRVQRRQQQPREQPKPRVQQIRRTRDCDPVLDLDCDEKPLRSGSSGQKSELSPSDVLGVIKRNLRTVDNCAAKHSAKGTIKVEWRILKSGSTSSVRVMTPNLANTPVGDCVEGAIKRWRFPASSKPPSESVKFPFKLKG